MIRHRENRIVIQYPARRIGPSGKMCIVPLPTWLGIDDDSFENTGKCGWRGHTRDEWCRGIESVVSLAGRECKGEFFEVLIQRKRFGNDLCPL